MAAACRSPLAKPRIDDVEERDDADDLCAIKIGPLRCFCVRSIPTFRRWALSDESPEDDYGSPVGGCEWVELEVDCFALAAAPRVNMLVATVMPFLAAVVQISVLCNLALNKDFAFAEEWLQPRSRSMGVNFMKCVGLCLVFFKISIELEHAMRLCVALFVCNFRGGHSLCCGWWAVMLQYTMGMVWTFVAVSIVLGSQGALQCATKVLAGFIILDIDNYAGRFLRMLLHFEVALPVKPECRRPGPDWVKYTSWRMRACFFGVPFLYMIMLCSAAVSFNIVPLTYVVYGDVSNRQPPSLAMSGGCCPPMLERHGGDNANYSVLVLADLQAPPPIVHWVALPATAVTPSPLQVLQGYDGDNNEAFRRGAVRASRVQAGFWLERHGFQGSSYTAIRDGDQLDTRTLPYSAAFLVGSLPLFGKPFLIYAAAQNPRTLALSPTVAQSSTFVTTVCAPHCAGCDRAGPGRCDVCESRAVLDDEGLCQPCQANCNKCSTPDACSDGGCEAGYGVNSHGGCSQCEIANCFNCQRNMSYCHVCQQGYGVNSTGGCARCSDTHCSCSQEGACDYCASGWGVTENGTCQACHEEGCEDCDWADSELCKSCSPGYRLESSSIGGICRQCMAHCQNCSSSTAARDVCDECRPGFGVSDTGCKPCDLLDCERCVFVGGSPRCLRCGAGFVVTEGGSCQDCGANCKLCSLGASCIECNAGYAPHEGQCWSCADRCADCAKAGPNRCDQCLRGFVLDSGTGTCVRRAHHRAVHL